MATTTADARERHRTSNIFATGRPTNVPVKRIFAPGKRMQAAPTSAVPPVQEPNMTQDSLFDGSLPSSWTFSQNTQTVSREAYEENQRLRAEEKAEQERELEPSPSPPPPPPQPKPLPSSRTSYQNPSSTLSQQYMQRALKSNEKRDLQDPDYQEQDDITTPKRQYVTRSRTSANANVSFNDEHERRHTPPSSSSPSSRVEEEGEESIDEEDSSSGPDEIPAIYQDVPTSSAQRRVVVVKSKPPRKSPPSKKSNEKQTSRLSPVPQRPTQTEEEDFLGFGMEIDHHHQSPDSERSFTTTTPRRVPQTTIPSHTTRPDVSSRSDEELVRDLRAARAGLERAEARTRKAMAAEREALDRKEKIWAEMEKRFACASPKRGMM